MEQQNKKPITLGSLFDGSGGFPLGGVLAGITPIWLGERILRCETAPLTALSILMYITKNL